jgi:hypothetical protein
VWICIVLGCVIEDRVPGRDPVGKFKKVVGDVGRMCCAMVVAILARVVKE